MQKTILKIKMLYPKMGKAEKKIADWIMENPNGLIPLSITELAEKCSCGEATIVRFARRLELGGYQELKISIAQEEGSSELTDGITENDSCFRIFDKVSNDIYCSLEATKKEIDSDALENAAKALLEANQIMIYGLGNSASVALDFEHKMLRAGLCAKSYAGNNRLASYKKRCCNRNFAFGLVKRYSRCVKNCQASRCFDNCNNKQGQIADNKDI